MNDIEALETEAAAADLEACKLRDKAQAIRERVKTLREERESRPRPVLYELVLKQHYLQMYLEKGWLMEIVSALHVDRLKLRIVGYLDGRYSKQITRYATYATPIEPWSTQS